MSEKVYDIAIVGGGAAGLTAAIYARRAEKSVIVFEKLVAGGQIVNTPKISNYPATPGISGAEWAKALEKQALDLGTEIEYEEIISIEKNDSIFHLRTEDDEFKAKAVIFSAGLTDRKMDIPNEEEFVGRGISYCATCDGAFYKDKIVAVIGGGNSALGSALYLSEIAKKVYLVHRRFEYRATEILQEKIAERENIEPVLGYVPSEIIAEGKKVVGLKLVNNVSESRELNLDGVFVAIGKVPHNDLIAELVDFDENGYAITDENCATKTPGLFVAGDCRAKTLRQLVTATADGAVAASSAINYLQ